jgi:cysteine-rich repeat protein
LDEGEECDDSLETERCNADCSVSDCGDGIENLRDGEECDDGGESATCNVDCTWVLCGDGIVNAAAGEECDEGNIPAKATARCNADCTKTACGDGKLNLKLGEECDDGGESASCDADCTASACGDGTVNAKAGEQCDGGGESAACNRNCTVSACGDGIVNLSAGEACDEIVQTATCSANCALLTCGDGIVNELAGEECDDAGESSTCDADCTFQVCGDATRNATASEACDDGGETAACDADCTFPVCGDGIPNIPAGEACDDMGESIDCDDDCTEPSCPDGVANVAAGEDCDDGNKRDGDGCDSDCTWSCVVDDDCSQLDHCTNHVCSAPHWWAPLLVSDQASTPDELVLTLDGLGNLVVAWTDSTPTINTTSVAVSPSGADFGAPAIVSGLTDGDSYPTGAGSDMAGNVILGIATFPATGFEVHAARYVASDGLTSPVLVGTGSGWPNAAAVWLLPSGSAYAAWMEVTPVLPTGEDRGLVGAIDSGGWAAAAALESDPTPFDSGPVVDSKSEGILSAGQAAQGIFVSHVKGAFGSLQQVVTLPADTTLDGTESIAIDGVGNALLAWGERNTVAGSLAAKLKIYTAFSNTWGTTATLQANGSVGVSPRVALNGSGNGVVAYLETVSSKTSVHAALFSSSSGLGTAFEVAAPTTNPIDGLWVGVDENGNLIVVWVDRGPTTRIRSRRYRAFGNWETVIATIAAVVSMDSFVGSKMQPDGRAAVAWTVGSDIYAARFE